MLKNLAPRCSQIITLSTYRSKARCPAVRACLSQSNLRVRSLTTQSIRRSLTPVDSSCLQTTLLRFTMWSTQQKLVQKLHFSWCRIPSAPRTSKCASAFFRLTTVIWRPLQVNTAFLFTTSKTRLNWCSSSNWTCRLSSGRPGTTISSAVKNSTTRLPNQICLFFVLALERREQNLSGKRIQKKRWVLLDLLPMNSSAFTWSPKITWKKSIQF